MKKIVGFIGCLNKKMSRKEAFMSKKYLSLSLVLLLLIPVIVGAKSMFEENFEREQKELKSESTALLGSLTVTAAPVFIGAMSFSGNSEDFGLSLAFAGLLVGPSAGHFYANQTGRGLKGIGIRLAIALGTSYFISKSTEGHHPDETVMTGGLGVLGGGALILIHGIYDMCTTPSSVRKYNESLMEENSLRLVPEVDPFNESYGLSLVYGF